MDANSKETNMLKIEQAGRLAALPPYLFKELDRMRDEVRAKGVDIIDLGVGDPDQPTPGHIVARLNAAAQDPANHAYPSYTGMKEYRRTVAVWFKNRFGVDLDPDKQVLALLGSKEGIAHLPLAFINPGDVALVPEPAYPVYNIGTMFAGGQPYFMPLLEKNGFLPDLEAIPADVTKKAKIIFINYPNNPTGATAEPGFYKKVVDFAKENQLIVVSDAAYSEMAYDGYKPTSFLEIPGAMDVGIEFHSLSKTYNMTGYRIGWAAGREEIVDGLGRIKSNIDSGAYQAVQIAAIEALSGDQSCVGDMARLYTERRDAILPGLKEIGLSAKSPKATFYIWIKTPAGYTSADFTARLLTETGIVVTPGNGFGPSGEGYVRMALTKSVDRLREAVDRIKKLNL